MQARICHLIQQASKLEFGIPSMQLCVVICMRLRNVLSVDTASSIGVIRLLPSDTNKLTHLLPESDRGIQESLFICVDDGLLPNQVSLARLDPLGLVDELPDDEQWWDE